MVSNSSMSTYTQSPFMHNQFFLPNQPFNQIQSFNVLNQPQSFEPISAMYASKPTPVTSDLAWSTDLSTSHRGTFDPSNLVIKVVGFAYKEGEENNFFKYNHI